MTMQEMMKKFKRDGHCPSHGSTTVTEDVQGRVYINCYNGSADREVRKMLGHQPMKITEKEVTK